MILGLRLGLMIFSFSVRSAMQVFATSFLHCSASKCNKNVICSVCAGRPEKVYRMQCIVHFGFVLVANNSINTFIMILFFQRVLRTKLNFAFAARNVNHYFQPRRNQAKSGQATGTTSQATTSANKAKPNPATPLKIS